MKFFEVIIVLFQRGNFIGGFNLGIETAPLSKRVSHSTVMHGSGKSWNLIWKYYFVSHTKTSQRLRFLLLLKLVLVWFALVLITQHIYSLVSLKHFLRKMVEARVFLLKVQFALVLSTQRIFMNSRGQGFSSR